MKPSLPYAAMRPAALRDDAALEPLVVEVEARLATLAQSLREPDGRHIDSAATELQRALAAALDGFSVAARRGPVSLALRQRLASASGQVAAQREALARAMLALDRAMDILIPRAVGGYTAQGHTSQATHSGLARA